MSSSNIWKKIGIGAAITGGVVAGVALCPIFLGFGTAGVVGGSIAAGIQSVIGNVAAGSLFAVCTSLGMSGVFATSAAVGTILGAGGLVVYLNSNFSPEKDAELIHATIENRDNPDLIIKLLEARFPLQREEIRQKYNKLYNNKNNDDNNDENKINEEKKDEKQKKEEVEEEIEINNENKINEEKKDEKHKKEEAEEEINLNNENKINEEKNEEKQNRDNTNFDEDIINFVPIDMREHVSNLLIDTNAIEIQTDFIRQSFNNQTFQNYVERDFYPIMDAMLIDQIIENKDNPLIIVRLLNCRNEEQRKLIDLKFRELKGDDKKKMIHYILDFMANHPEASYIHQLLG
jgi:hypothetical protein